MLVTRRLRSHSNGPRQRLVEVAQVEQQVALGRGPQAEVEDVGVTAHLDLDPGVRPGGQIGGHHRGRAAVVRPRRQRHARVADRDQLGEAVRALLEDDRQRVRLARGRIPRPERTAGDTLARSLARRRQLVVRGRGQRHRGILPSALTTGSAVWLDAGRRPVACPTGALRRRSLPFRSRSYTIMWIGALVSNIGTWMETVALAYYVADTTGQGVMGRDRRRRRVPPLGDPRPDRLGDVGPPAPRPDARGDELDQRADRRDARRPRRHRPGDARDHRPARPGDRRRRCVRLPRVPERPAPPRAP